MVSGHLLLHFHLLFSRLQFLVPPLLFLLQPTGHHLLVVSSLSIRSLSSHFSTSFLLPPHPCFFLCCTVVFLLLPNLFFVPLEFLDISVFLCASLLLLFFFLLLVVQEIVHALYHEFQLFCVTLHCQFFSVFPLRSKP